MNEKMNNKSNAPLILSSLIVFILISYMIVAFDDQFNWFESYRNDDDQPYGTEVFYSLLNESMGKENCYLWGDSLNTPPSENLLYVFIGNYPYLDSSEVEKILELSKNGNEVFISARQMNPYLLQGLFPEDMNLADTVEFYEDLDYSFTDSIDLNDTSNTEDWEDDYFNTPDLDSIPTELLADTLDDYFDFEDELEQQEILGPLYVYSVIDNSIFASLKQANYSFEFSSVHENIRDDRHWKHFGNKRDSLSIGEYQISGLLNDSLINYIQIPNGQGKVHLHLLPLAFSNISLLDTGRYHYVKTLFSELNFEHVVWDEENKIMSDRESNFTNQEYTPSESPLSFILSKRGLKWAWYGMLLCAVIYILFGAKRTQRILPVEHALKNSSLQYANTIGELYVQQKDHRIIAMLQWKLFLNAIRNYYGLHTQTESEDEKLKLIQSISLKSGIELEQIEDLFESYRQITIVFKVSNENLVSFYNKLESFYSERK